MTEGLESGEGGRDQVHMAEALDLARQGDFATSPNPMVGCVVVRDDQVVGRGYHRQAGQEHAEVVALRDAGGAAEGAEVYVTLEPCAHQGRTGPCVAALLASRPRRVIVAMTDPNPLVAGRGIATLRDAGVAVDVGVGEADAARLNEFFITSMVKARPFVTVKFAASLDGKIATRTGASHWISGPESRKLAHQLRHRHDAIMVGVATVIADDPALTSRDEGRGTALRQPVRVVLDSTSRTPPTARLLGEAGQTLIATTDRADPAQVEVLRSAGADVAVLRASPAGGVDVLDLLADLHRRELLSVLVEGGGAVLGSVFDAGVVDKVVAFLAPRIIGGRDAPVAVAGLGVAELDQLGSLRDVEVDRLGDDLVVSGYCQH